jgi:hypothetical protein
MGEVRCVALLVLVLEMGRLAMRAWLWNVGYGVACPRVRQEDGVNGGKAGRYSSLTIAGYAWSRAKGKALDTGIVTLMDGLKRSKAKERV